MKMHCPNCGATNASDVRFCRNCGLGLDRISKLYAEESEKLTAGAPGFSERFFRKLGIASLIGFASMGFGFLFALASYYKFQIFGKEVMAGFAIFGFLLLGALSFVFLGLSRYAARSLPQAEEGPEYLPEGDRAEPLPGSSAASAQEELSKTTRRLEKEPR